MVLGALSSARAGMASGVALLDRGAERVARASAFAAPAPTGPPGQVLAAATASDGLVEGMTDLLLSRTVLAANVSTARRADEAYRSVLGLLDR